MIMACRPQTSETPVCYTFSGERGRTLDDRVAGRVAEACGLEHRLLRIGPDFFSDFASHADRTVYITDGCCGVSGAHEIYMNAQARELAPVRLTGNFGSEVFRGVSTFKPIGLSPKLFNPELIGLWTFRSDQATHATNIPLLLRRSRKYRGAYLGAWQRAVLRLISGRLTSTMKSSLSRIKHRTAFEHRLFRLCAS